MGEAVIVTVNWGEVGLGATAILALVVVVVELLRSRKQGDLASAVAAAVKSGVSEVVKPLYQGLQNNTDALQEIRLALAEQSGKFDAVIKMQQGGGHS